MNIKSAVPAMGAAHLFRARLIMAAVVIKLIRGRAMSAPKEGRNIKPIHHSFTCFGYAKTSVGAGIARPVDDKKTVFLCR